MEEKVGEGGREKERKHQIVSQEAGFWLLAAAFISHCPFLGLAWQDGADYF